MRAMGQNPTEDEVTFVIVIIITIIIIITRPRPAFHRLGLGGSLGGYSSHKSTSRRSLFRYSLTDNSYYI